MNKRERIKRRQLRNHRHSLARRRIRKERNKWNVIGSKWLAKKHVELAIAKWLSRPAW